MTLGKTSRRKDSDAESVATSKGMYGKLYDMSSMIRDLEKF